MALVNISNPSDVVLPVGTEPAEVLRLKGEIRLLQFIAGLRAHLAGARDVETALRRVARSCMEFFRADAVMVAASEPPYANAEWLFAVPQGSGTNLPVLAELIRGYKPELPGNVIFARLRRRDRNWGILALRVTSGEFARLDRQWLARVGPAVNDLIAQIDIDRTREVRDRIDRKIMDQLQPIDLAYQVLDGLRSLTRYDHSSAMLMNDGTGQTLEMVAEQIAWQKAKSQRIGQRISVDEPIKQLLMDGSVYGFSRGKDGWVEWTGRAGADALATLLSSDLQLEQTESEMLIAPLRGRDEFLGVLKVSSCYPGALGPHELKLLEGFLPQASIAVQIAQRSESLRMKMIATERKHVLAGLARAVSHDLNNALGSVLPLLQELCHEAETGVLDPTECKEDLRQIEISIQACHRIFQRMLNFSRPTGETVGAGHLRAAIDNTLGIMAQSMRRLGIEAEVSLAENLPEVRASLSDLEQLLLNLVGNARDAMLENGGRLTITASREDTRLRLEVTDTGCGVLPEHLARLEEPFFTTKSGGTGLGLSICRSIVTESGGELNLSSKPGQGMVVVVHLPSE